MIKPKSELIPIEGFRNYRIDKTGVLFFFERGKDPIALAYEAEKWPILYDAILAAKTLIKDQSDD